MNLLEIKQKFINQINLKGFSEQTLYSYWWHTESFINFCKPKHLTVLSSQDVNNYLVHISEKSDSFRNQAINGIKFYFDYVLHRKIKTNYVIRPKKKKTQPVLLTDDELQSMFDICENIKQKSILALLYSSGLRVSEIINLKIKDIDSKEMVIWVRQAKGKKDRMVILSQPVLELLRVYFKQTHPKEWLYNGQILKHESKDTIKQYSVRSIQQFVKNIAIKAKIIKRVHPHLLRHGYCTGILSNGGDIHDVAVTAGHSSLKTSMGYIHLSTKYISKINSPINNIRL